MLGDQLAVGFSIFHIKKFVSNANSANQDQTPRYAASDQVLYCLLSECTL